MICPHCHREQKDSSQKVCQFCKKSLHPDSSDGSEVHAAEAAANFRNLKAKASAGDPHDNYQLGLLYFHGRGCEPNISQAVRCFESAARSGFAAAEYILAIILLQDSGDKNSIRRALGLLSQSSRHGHPGAEKLLHEIGHSYRQKTKNQILFKKPEEVKGMKNQVRSAYFLPDDNANTCPRDQYELHRQLAFLACYSVDPLGIKGFLRLPLLHCSQCENWYISSSILRLMVNEDFDPAEIDIINSPEHPRSPELEKLYKPQITPVSHPKRERKGKSSSPRASSGRRRSNLHLAVRCQYCDGGATEKIFGFRGICSPENYQYQKRHSSTSWCASKDNECQNWREEDLQQGIYPCTECHLLIDWACADSKTGAGKKPTRKIAGNRSGQVAVMTTVLPGESESDRLVFAMFTICEPDEAKPGELCADQRLRVELERDESILFWDHYQGGKQAKRPAWGSPFYRNLSDSQIASILSATLEKVEDSPRQEIIKEMLATLPETDSLLQTGAASE